MSVVDFMAIKYLQIFTLEVVNRLTDQHCHPQSCTISLHLYKTVGGSGGGGEVLKSLHLKTTIKSLNPLLVTTQCKCLFKSFQTQLFEPQLGGFQDCLITENDNVGVEHLGFNQKPIHSPNSVCHMMMSVTKIYQLS